MAGKSKVASRSATAVTDEQKIVRASDHYIRNIADFIVGDLTDITGDNVHMFPFDWRQRSPARAALSEIAALKATTLHGLAAKARVVKVILDLDDAVGNLEEDEFAFLKGFAEEARVFFAEAAIEERKAARAARA